MTNQKTKDYILSLIDKVIELRQSYMNDAPCARETLMSLSQALTASLELPCEALQRMGWAEPAKMAHCKMAVDMNLFQNLAQAGTGGITAEEVAVIAEADIKLTRRLLRHLSAMHVIAEADPGVYLPTPTSTGFADPSLRDGITYLNDVAGPSFQQMPEYFKKIRYQDPELLPRGPFQYAHGTNTSLATWLTENPPYDKVLNSYLSAYRVGKPSWTDQGFYPVQDRLVNGFDPVISPVMLVDVGGGLGKDLRELKARYPALPGQLILQDQEKTIAQVRAAEISMNKSLVRSDNEIFGVFGSSGSLGAGMEPGASSINGAGSNDFSANSSAMAALETQSSPSSSTYQLFYPQSHDILKRQPVRHARAYHLRGVLHDRSDEECVRILTALVPSLRFEYSRVLISEVLVPTTVDDGYTSRRGAYKGAVRRMAKQREPEAGASVNAIGCSVSATMISSWAATSSDWLAMALTAGRERTEFSWRELIRRAGLRVVAVYGHEFGGEECLIEAELADKELEGVEARTGKTVTFGGE